MPQSRLITLAIHTYERAIAVKAILESEGIKVTLQNVNLEQPAISAGIRVRISESDLPQALRIIENSEIFTRTSIRENEPTLTVLVPVDFSAYSLKAVNVAFDTAAKHGASITILHAYTSPFLSDNMELSDNLTFEMKDSETRKRIENEACRMLDEFAGLLKTKITHGELPPVNFTTKLAEGVPEEVIVEFIREHSPWLIVMGTRGSGKKERELVGSVTAEVLDSCRTLAITVPEDHHLPSLDRINNIVLFGNLDQEDILALDTLHRVLNKHTTRPLNITMACIPGKKHTRVSSTEAQNNMQEYCREHYPASNIEVKTLTLDDIFNDYTRMNPDKRFDMIAVANKKRNIFSRLFNPALPHRLLFHFDIPMLVIPV